MQPVALVCLILALAVVAVAARPQALPSPPVRHVHFVDATPDHRKYRPPFFFSKRQHSFLSVHGRFHSFLFRGGDPNVGRHGAFDYDALTKSIQLAAERVNVALPPKFYLIDIKYLHPRASHTVNFVWGTSIRELNLVAC